MQGKEIDVNWNARAVDMWTTDSLPRLIVKGNLVYYMRPLPPTKSFKASRQNQTLVSGNGRSTMENAPTATGRKQIDSGAGEKGIMLQNVLMHGTSSLWKQRGKPEIEEINKEP